MVDVYNLTEAIDGAHKGDTILLGAGVFDLTLQSSKSPCQSDSDCASSEAWCLPDPTWMWVDCTDPAADCRCHDSCVTDTDCGDGESCAWVCVPGEEVVIPLPDHQSMPYSALFGHLDRTQVFLVDVPALTIRGTLDEAGTPLTTLTVDRTWADHPWFGSDGFLFILGAPDVTIRDLVISGTGTPPAWSFWGGWTFTGIVFDEVGKGPEFWDDERTLTRKSRFAGNTFINSGRGIHVSSNAVVEDNFFEFRYGYAIEGSPWRVFSLPGDQGGFGLPLQRLSTHDVEVEDNVFIGGGSERVRFHALMGGQIFDNTVEGNEFYDAAIGIWASANSRVPDSSTSDITIKGNYFENIGIPVVLGNHVHGSAVKGNTLVDTAGYEVGVTLGLGAYDNVVKGNTYTDSGYPGLLAHCDDTEVAVYLLDSTHDNRVDENRFPEGTSVCEQVVDYGVGNKVQGAATCPWAPPSVTGTGTDGSFGYPVVYGQTGAFSATVRGLAGAEKQAAVVGPWEPVVHLVDVPAGTALARFATYDEYTDLPGLYDLDLEVYKDGVRVGSSGGKTAAEQVDVVDPAPGTYEVWVWGYNVWASDLAGAEYVLFAYAVGAGAAGNLTVTGPSQVRAGDAGTLEASWHGLDSCTRYLGFVEHSGLRCHDTLVEIATDTDSVCSFP